MHRLSPRVPSPSMLVALLALFVALGGSAYAVQSAKAPKNSVVAKSIKKGAVTKAKLAPGAVGSRQLALGAVGSAQLADGAVTGAKVAPGSIDAAKIDVASLKIPGPVTFKLRTVSKNVNFPVGGTEQLLSPCLPGEQIVGGGARSALHTIALTESTPSEGKPQTWYARFTSIDSTERKEIQIQATAVCASR